MNEFRVLENGLVPIYADDSGKGFCVNARDLHEYLEIAKDFTDWIKVQVRINKLLEGKDFLIFPFKGENSAGRPRTEYMLTLRAASYISQASESDKGLEAREFFYDMAMTLKEVIQNPRIALQNLSKMEILEMAMESERQLEEANKVIESQKKQLAELSNYTSSPITVTTAAKVIGISRYNLQSSLNLIFADELKKYTDKYNGLRIYYNTENKHRKPTPVLCFTQEGFGEIIKMLHSKKNNR